MKKKWCDILGIIFLVLGVVVLPFCKGRFDINDQLMTVVICGTTISLILLMKVVGYKTGYSDSERKDDRINFWILLLLLIGLLSAGVVVAK